MRRGLMLAGIFSLTLGVMGQVVLEEIGALQESFSSAQQAYQAVQFPKAVESINPLVDTLSRWEKAGRLQPSDEALLERALELRGICFFNLGKTELARQDWSRLVQLRPEYPFALTKNPKIVRAFEDIRSSLTGTLVLGVEPTDSQVFLDGRSLGMASGSLPVLRGLHTLRVSRPGYEPQERELTVDLGTSVQVAVKLVPNARTIYFFVQPEGTQLLVDGKPVGRADKAASSQEDWARFAGESGTDPSRVYVVPAPYLPPGDHRVAMAYPCYRKREFALNVVLDRVNNSPGFVKPITLERRTVNLEVLSHPSGSEVTIDGQVAGTTPLRLSDFCIGPHELLVRKAGVGLYHSTINVTETPVFKVEATLRPTLLWVGLTRDQEVTSRQHEMASEAMAAALHGMAHFNGTIADEKNPVLPDTFFTPGVGDQDQAAAVKDLCERYRCQGLLAGKLTAEGNELSLSLRLFVPSLPGYDESSAIIKDAPSAASALTLVDRPLIEAVQPVLVDLPGAKGPVFVRGLVDPAGPAAGDVLLYVGSKAVATAAAASAALAGADSPALRFSHRGEEKTWRLKDANLAELVPFGGETYGYRRQWLKARQGVAGSETPQERLVSGLSLAFANLNLGRPVEAMSALEPLQAPASGVLDQNTVNYLKAVALVQLGRAEEGRTYLNSSVGDPVASLDGTGGVLVAPLARDLLRQLPPPPPPPLPAAAPAKAP